MSNFYQLTPDFILNSLEELNLVLTGEMTQLNSYENRVFDIKLEDPLLENDRIIAKYYRPDRWSEKAILEEHSFLYDLKKEGVHVVAPLQMNNTTLFQKDNILFSLFPKFKGRMPQEFLNDDLKKVGRTLARLHNVGAQKQFEFRPHHSVEVYGHESLDILEDWVAPEVSGRYFDAADVILKFLEDRLPNYKTLRIHGDCHKGNLLNNGQEFFFVDFDDCVTGIEAQDFWMLLDKDNIEAELSEILSGYEELRDFDSSQMELFEPLRGLRIIYYARWIATRWTDPSFPKLFPNFETYPYWAQEVEQLERIAWKL